jgi:hypothetical protein
MGVRNESRCSAAVGFRNGVGKNSVHPSTRLQVCVGNYAPRETRLVNWLSRIAFGKHKGRLFQEARKDAELRRWLDWLANSSNARSAKMGRWYLRQLEIEAEPQATAVFATARIESKGKRAEKSRAIGLAALVIYVNPELEQLRQLVAAERARLAQLEADYTKEKSRVSELHENVPIITR